MKHSPKPWQIFLLGLLVFLPAASRRGLWAPDEPRHAEVARAMLVDGDYLVPHLHGEPYGDKPAFPFWPMAASMKVFGVHEFAARIPFALAAAGSLAITSVIGGMLFGPTVQVVAPILLLSSGMYLWSSQRVALDIVFGFFSLVAYLGLLRQVLGRGGPFQNGLIFFVGCALAVLTKGPHGVIFPILVGLIHALTSPRPRPFFSWRFWSVAPLFALIVASWVVPACLAGGTDYTQELLFRQSVGRVVSASNHQHAFPYYFYLFPLVSLPWSPLWIAALVLAARKSFGGAEASRRFALCWLIVPFLALSCVGSKRSVYLLPLFPVASILAAQVVAEALAGERRAERVARGVAVGAGSLLGLVGVAVLIAPWVPRVQEEGLEGLVPLSVAVSIPFLVASWVALRSYDRPWQSMRATAVGLAVVAIVAGLFVMPVIDAAKSAEGIARQLVDVAGTDAGRVPFLKIKADAYRFYSTLDCREVDDRDEFVEWIRGDDFRIGVIRDKEYRRLKGEGSIPDGVTVLARSSVGSKELIVLVREDRLPR